MASFPSLAAAIASVASAAAKAVADKKQTSSGSSSSNSSSNIGTGGGTKTAGSSSSYNTGSTATSSGGGGGTTTSTKTSNASAQGGGGSVQSAAAKAANTAKLTNAINTSMSNAANATAPNNVAVNDGWVGIPVSGATPTSQSTPATTAAKQTATLVNAGSGQVSHAGQGTLYMRADGSIVRDMGNGNAYVVNKGDEKYNALWDEYVGGIVSQANTPTGSRAGYTNEGGGASGASGAYAAYPSMEDISNMISEAMASAPVYTPVDQSAYMGNVLSYEDAVAMARQALAPQYERLYEQSAAQAAQNLGASGLYDSLYGQALSAEAQRDIDRDLNAAIESLALQLQGQSRDEALALLQLAIGENQYGASFNQSAALANRDYYERMLDRSIAQANADRDYALAQQAQDLKVRVQNFAEKQANWQMGGFDSAYQMEQALMQLEAQQKKSSSSGSGGNDSRPPDLDVKKDATQQDTPMEGELPYIWEQTGRNADKFRAVALQAGYSDAQISSFLVSQSY